MKKYSVYHANPSMLLPYDYGKTLIEYPPKKELTKDQREYIALVQLSHNDISMFIHRMKYEFVALVYADNLDEVFRSTNNIDSAWVDNPNVMPVSDVEGFRSTSIGDVIVEMSTGTAYIVESVGFRELPLDKDSTLW